MCCVEPWVWYCFCALCFCSEVFCRGSAWLLWMTEAPVSHTPAALFIINTYWNTLFFTPLAARLFPLLILTDFLLAFLLSSPFLDCWKLCQGNSKWLLSFRFVFFPLIREGHGMLPFPPKGAAGLTGTKSSFTQWA